MKFLWQCLENGSKPLAMLPGCLKQFSLTIFMCVGQGLQVFPRRRFKPLKNWGGKNRFFPPKREKYGGSPRFLRPLGKNIPGKNTWVLPEKNLGKIPSFAQEKPWEKYPFPGVFPLSQEK